MKRTKKAKPSKPPIPKPGTVHRTTDYRRRKRAAEAAAKAATNAPATTAAEELQLVGLPGAAPGGPIHVEPPAGALDVDPLPEATPDPTVPADDDGATDADDGAPGSDSDAAQTSTSATPSTGGGDAEPATRASTTASALAGPGESGTPSEPSSSAPSDSSPSSSSPTDIPTSDPGPRSGLCHTHRNAPTRCAGSTDGKPCEGFVYPPLEHDDAMRSADALIPTLARMYLRGEEPPPLDDQERHAWGHVFQETRAMYGWPNPGQSAILTAAGLAFSYAGKVQERKKGGGKKGVLESAELAELRKLRAEREAARKREQAAHDREQDDYYKAEDERRRREEAAAATRKPAAARADVEADADDDDGDDDVPEHAGALGRRAA